MLAALPPWEAMLKKIAWAQLGDVRNKRILDFGSGIGITANHYAKHNEVVAVEPSADSVEKRWKENAYQQLLGSTDCLNSLKTESFDVILCHNVLEYVSEREPVIQQFHRLLKPNGTLSIIKHNRPGRVMQMAVLLNDFKKANDLLDGKHGTAAQYGTIRYFDDADLIHWCNDLRLIKNFGIRTFWDLQQNQECHNDPTWQEQMLALEMRVSEIEEYRNIAFFHHLIFQK